MERKTQLEISLAIGVILLFILALMWWLRRPAAVTTTSTTTSAAITASTTKPATTSNGADTSTTPTTPVAVQTSPTTVARTFVERIGSYSSEADAANIEDIIGMATASFKSKLEALVREARATANGSYYGVSTQVLTAPKTISSTDAQVVMSMTTQREETIDTPGNTTVKYQEITITLVKSGTTWLVDGYTWK
jgi:hypothetical protein